MKLWPRVWCLVFLTHGVVRDTGVVTVTADGAARAVAVPDTGVLPNTAVITDTGVNPDTGVAPVRDEGVV